MPEEPTDATKTAEEEEAQARHEADRPPTEEESRAAGEAAADVNLAEVSKHYDEMAEIGAEVKGEGEIVPERRTE